MIFREHNCVVFKFSVFCSTFSLKKKNNSEVQVVKIAVKEKKNNKCVRPILSVFKFSSFISWALISFQATGQQKEIKTGLTSWQSLDVT